MSDVILQFDEVSMDFDGKLALDKISFTVQAGETFILFGAAGSGKTVLLKLAMSLLSPTSGRILLLGHDITSMKESELFGLRAEVGVLFQEGGLFDSLTIADNVAYPLRNQMSLLAPEDEIAVRIQESLDFVELGHTLDKFPSELSGGMRRRVGIARANVTNPKISLYDSPTAGLDPITAHTIMSLIIKQRQLRHTTTILASHRYQDGSMAANYIWDEKAHDVVRAAPPGKYADLRTTFLVMSEGRIVFSGTQQQLELSRDPYVSQFVLHQPPPKPLAGAERGQPQA
ncbi:ABC transporter ATP-binding protein [Bryobacter aggregatus]|uniref:ABC transporter ATP-binding protein n=1 Tax=Bryobacter aggregatus TaxID=360054 RepID=UPI00068B93D1|nr:ATP-binding cassette domain-containing protein [Bryobacter aggregatus]